MTLGRNAGFAGSIVNSFELGVGKRGRKAGIGHPGDATRSAGVTNGELCVPPARLNLSPTGADGVIKHLAVSARHGNTAAIRSEARLTLNNTCRSLPIYLLLL